MAWTRLINLHIVYAFLLFSTSTWLTGLWDVQVPSRVSPVVSPSRSWRDRGIRGVVGADGKCLQWPPEGETGRRVAPRPGTLWVPWASPGGADSARLFMSFWVLGISYGTAMVKYFKFMLMGLYHVIPQCKDSNPFRNQFELEFLQTSWRRRKPRPFEPLALQLS